MRIEDDIKLDYGDVLIKPKRSCLSSRSGVDITRTLKHPNGNAWYCTPIIVANMDTVGTFEMALSLENFNCMVALHKHYHVQALIDFYVQYNPSNVFYSMGTSDADMEKLKYFIEAWGGAPDKICIDVANGYTQMFLDKVRMVRELYPDSFILAGNVVTPEMTEELILSGVNCVKIGIGSGSACITRIVTSIGYPQLSAVIECADAAHGLGGYICADGGCTVPGDVVKAFGGGADFVMLGGMLSGTTESNGKQITIDGKEYKQYYGMSSDTAMDKHHGGVASYRASEGNTVNVPYTGDVSQTMQTILGGLRSGMTYIGAKTLKEVPKRTTFIRVNRQLNNIFS